MGFYFLCFTSRMLTIITPSACKRDLGPVISAWSKSIEVKGILFTKLGNNFLHLSQTHQDLLSMFVLKIFNSDASQQVILPQDKTNFERGYNPFFYRCSTFLFVAAFKCTYPWPEFQLEEIWYDKSSHLTCLLKLHSIRFYYVHFLPAYTRK